MSQQNPTARLIEAYRGPAAVEWLYGLALSFLIATNLQTFALMRDPQTAARYYSEIPGVMLMQYGGMAINFLVLAICLTWIILPGRKLLYLQILAVLAASGTLLGWFELARALEIGKESFFSLHELPFRPVHNMGLVGTQIHLSYLILRSPGGKTLEGWSWVVRAGLCLCLALAQWAVWDRIVAGR